MGKITILIVDDHKLVRECWKIILNTDPLFYVVAECGSAEEAIDIATTLHPNVIILDINLPGMSGLEGTATLRKVSPASKILGVSLHTEPSYACKMFRNGALGYL